MAVTVTESAACAIMGIIKKEDLDPEKIRLRVGVKGGGCSGFNYVLDLTEAQKESDEIWEYTYPVPAKAKPAKGIEISARSEEGNVAVAQEQGESFTIRVICDPKSYLYLNGTSIDYKDELMGSGFVFNNPNATSSCGCGSSFSA